jgi:mannose-6-phosphate isomerase-like protein (cupin superfamily)
MSGFEMTGEEIGAGVSVIVVNAAPGEGPRVHRHRYREVFVVLEGEATFTLGTDQRVALAGEVVVAPAGVAHRFVNTGPGPPTAGRHPRAPAVRDRVARAVMSSAGGSGPFCR